jgi:hypothetical protein
MDESRKQQTNDTEAQVSVGKAGEGKSAGRIGVAAKSESRLVRVTLISPDGGGFHRKQAFEQKRRAA